MNWEAIGAIGESAGSLAVFLTLIFLVVQVRRARHEVRRSISQGRGEGFRFMFAQRADDRINKLLVKANAALGRRPDPFVIELMEKVGLTEEEATLLKTYVLVEWNEQIQTIPYASELPEIERQIFEGSIPDKYGPPGVYRLFLECMRPYAHPDLVRYIDEKVAAVSHGNQ